MLTLSNTIRRTQTPDGEILLDVERGQIFSVNIVGSKILELLESGHNEARIVIHLSAMDGADVDSVRADVHDFLTALSRQHILNLSPETVGTEPEATDDNRHAT